MQQRNNVLVIDCFNLGHISFHAIGGELDYHGRRTGCMFLFIRQLLILAEKFNTRQFLFCWDSARSKRMLLDKMYKAKRRDACEYHTPQEIKDMAALHEQLYTLRDTVLPYLGFKNNYMRCGFEADDIMADLVLNTIGPGEGFVLVTTDSDLLQMLRDGVIMYNIRSKRITTENGFCKRFGIQPWQWPIAQAIGGDKSDSIVGVQGAGDPKNNPKSLALQYLRGELKEGGAVHKRIKEQWDSVVEHNLKLTKLPYETLGLVRQNHEHFSKAQWIEAFDSYGFDSFLKRENLNRWERTFLNG